MPNPAFCAFFGGNFWRITWLFHANYHERAGYFAQLKEDVFADDFSMLALGIEYNTVKN